MSKRGKKRATIGDYLVYAVYRSVSFLLSLLPVAWVFRGGQAVGFLGYVLLGPYRKLARRNVRIAFPDWSPKQIERCVRTHFQNLVANLLCGFVLREKSWERVKQFIDFTTVQATAQETASAQCIVAAVTHIGNWELLSTLPHWMDRPISGVIYQRQRNLLLDEHVRKGRARDGMEAIDRSEGLARSVGLLKRGGLLALLVDQHAGDKGVWIPFFRRLASTSPLPAILTKRTHARLLAGAMDTLGPAKWRIDIRYLNLSETASSEEIIAELNQRVEEQIRRNPADWFWLHNRWKTPSPRFLLRTYKRGVCVPAQAEPLQPFRMLIRSSNWLGDAVMSVEAVRRIKRGRPDAHVTILAQAKLIEFWRTVPEVDDVIGIDPADNAWQVAQKIKSRFEVAILFPNSPRTGLEVWLAGIPRRVGYRRPWRDFFLNQFIPEPKDSGPVSHHHAQIYLQIANQIGADMEEALPMIPRIGAEPRTVGLCPGAEYGPAKRWPYFGEAAKILTEKYQLNWLIFGTARERELAEDVARQIGPAANNLTGKTSLAGLIQELQRCQLLLTNDTGTMHLAAHLGVPTVAIFGSTEPALTGPIGQGHVVIRHQVECSPCFLRTCPIDFRCMERVKVAEVVAAVERLLDGRLPEANSSPGSGAAIDRRARRLRRPETIQGEPSSRA
jgi:heptosyltransferase II